MERLENMRRSAVGNGLSQCLLCGEMLGLLGSSSVLCLDCCMVQTEPNILNIVFFKLYTRMHFVLDSFDFCSNCGEPRGGSRELDLKTLCLSLFSKNIIRQATKSFHISST